MFGLALVPLVGLAGAAVDYSRLAATRVKLNVAADSASLAAVNKSALTLSKSDAEKLAVKVFNGNITTLTGVTLDTITASVTETTSTGRNAVVTYTASMPTSFMGIVGTKTMSLSGSSTANSGIPIYVDFYLLLDNTPSMGVGATTSDIAKMVANTSDQCAFACHDLSDSGDYYSLAKKLGVAMRIDVMRTATQNLMDTATTTQTVSGQFRMALYTFGSSATNVKLTTIQSLTSNLSTAKTAASNIDLMTVPYQNYAGDTDTNFGKVLTDMNSAVASPGNGLTSSTPLKYVFFVSDGVNDRVLGSTSCSQSTTTSTDPKTGTVYTRCQEPLDTSYCTTLKNRGIKIAVLYTTYLPLPTNDWWKSWIKPFTSKIATNMESCASSGLYFEVSPTEGISDAMEALFQKAVQQARLTK